jgi:hypothetical protein
VRVRTVSVSLLLSHLCTGLVVVLAVTLAPRRAGADALVGRPRVAVVRLAFDGGVPEAARDLFANRLAEGLAAAQLRVIPKVTVQERLIEAGLGFEIASCRAGSACMARAAAVLEVPYMVIAAVTEHDKTYDITLELVNGKGGASIGTSRERCEICGIEEASEKVGLAASALRARIEALVQTPARFIIRSRPTGARVTVDGLRIGHTPVDHELAAGAHKLALAAEGYDLLERTVTAVSGVDENLDLDMVPLPTKFPYRAAGWTAVVLGAVALAAGIFAITQDGKALSCAVGEQDMFGHCPKVRDTRVLGLSLVGAGAAVGTLGAIWIYFGNAGTPRQGDGGGATVASFGVGGKF